MLAEGSATYGNECGPQRAFGSTSLKTDGKIFAMLVKGRACREAVGRPRRGAVADGTGERFDPGHGRIQKEWLSVGGADRDSGTRLRPNLEAFVAEGEIGRADLRP